jgi:hypothetical protein
MPTRKQRRRRDKEQRHEYEFVTVDDEGHEVPVDPEEIKPKKERSPQSAGAKKGAQPTDRRGRPLRTVQPPSWRRAATRAIIFVFALFVFTSFVGKKKPTVLARVTIAVAYGAIGIPFFYWMDRASYRRYLRATGREDEIPTRTPRR